jgi:hypothetical protein
MGHSLEQRFNGQGDEVVQYAKDYGVAATMRKYDVKDSFAMDNFLKKKEPDYVFDYAKPESHEFSRLDAFDRLADSLYRKITSVQAENNELRAEISGLRKENEYLKRGHWNDISPRVSKLTNLCSENN